MKAQSNYIQLMGYVNEANALRAQNPFLALLNKEKIDRFFVQNAIRINEAKEKTNKLIDKHVLHDEKKMPKVENNQLVFKSDEDKAAYKEGWEKMNKVVFDITV